MSEMQMTTHTQTKYNPIRGIPSAMHGNGGSATQHQLLSSLTYDVLVEKIESRYVARALFWPQDVVIADTREEALTQAREVILKHLAQSELVSISIDPASIGIQQSTLNGSQIETNNHSEERQTSKNPLSKFFGMYKDHREDFEEFQAEMARYRDELDKELGMGEYMIDDTPDFDEQYEADNLVETNIEKEAVLT